MAAAAATRMPCVLYTCVARGTSIITEAVTAQRAAAASASDWPGNARKILKKALKQAGDKQNFKLTFTFQEYVVWLFVVCHVCLSALPKQPASQPSEPAAILR
jgi:hypothetical protein